MLLTRSLEEGGFGRFAVDHLVQTLAAAGVASPELTGWRADLEAAAGRGAFLLSLNDYVVLASAANATGHQDPGRPADNNHMKPLARRSGIVAVVLGLIAAYFLVPGLRCWSGPCSTSVPPPRW